eukprot:5573994-Pleurochrysis_carterae.AAC.1
MEFNILCLPFIVSWCTDLADANLAFALVYFAVRNESKSLTFPCGIPRDITVSFLCFHPVVIVA